MAFLVPRHFTEILDDAAPTPGHELAEYRDRGAYVLLGDPGAGKTETFKQEASATGGLFITARDFLDLDIRDTWRNTMLFIDALDESRAGEGDGRTPLSRIRGKLDQLGRPRFRLSCREVDWLGASDRGALQGLAPDNRIVTLRLEPLAEEQSLAILRSRPDVPDADAFFATARERGLAALLENPQTLHLLADALRGEDWPDSRAKTYDLACRQLVLEPNPEHLAAKRGKRPAIDRLLDAAGYLSAIGLLADIPAFSLNEADPGYPSPEHLSPPSPLPVSQALTTRLFKGLDGRQRFMPIHRSVAEYLAARYLAQRLEAGLPLGRVLALITGADGGVVSGLRGLHAWLAVHSPSGRATLIDTDPLGVVLYGDVQSFSRADKQRLLEGLRALARQHAGFRWQDWSASPFGALSTPEMEPVFRDILTSPHRDEAQQAMVDCVLDALRHGPVQPSLDEVLLAVVREGDRWPGVRSGALKVYLRSWPRDPAPHLKLLDHIHSGQVEDREDELLGMLLDTLYPGHISIRRLLDHLHPPKRPSLIGTYFYFWSERLANKLASDDLPVLLDELVKRRLPLDLTHEYHYREMVGALLVRGIEMYGEDAPVARLHAWLGIGLDEYSHPRLDRKHHERIEAWLSRRPQSYKEVLLHGLRTCDDEDKLRLCFHYCKQRLYGAGIPEDLGLWFLGLAGHAATPALARQLFEEAVTALIFEQGQQGLSLELLETWVQEHPDCQELLESLLYCEYPGWRKEDAARQRDRKLEKAKRRSTWRRSYRKHFAELRTGAVAPQNLHNLAMVYFDLYSDIEGETPWDRLMDLLDGDSELVQAALEGLRAVPLRPDLPTVDEIVELEAKGRMHFIRLPCLAAAEEIYRETPAALLAWPDGVLERLLAFRYTYAAGDEPAWVEALVTRRPVLVAKVLVTYVSRLFSAPKAHVHGLYPLQHDETYAEVARRAVLSLLKSFPPRARKNQLAQLETLLKAGLRHMERKDLASLIAHRLGLKSMDASQRVYWLAAGLVLDPMHYETDLSAFVGSNQTRARHLAGFFHGRMERGSPEQILPPTSLGLLIRLLGSGCSPVEWSSGAHWISPAMETAELVQGLINRLGGSPEEEAAHQLQRLVSDPKLPRWQGALRHAMQSQQVSRREALYRHPSREEVEHTLADLQPANAADLAALTGEYLRELAHWMRDGNIDAYKQFWNEDSHRHPTSPKVEESCRDILVDKLRERLGRLGIDIQPEARHADEKRSDIRVSWGGAHGFHIPIEIKRDRHRDLWRAMREQLIAQYTRDPGCMGRGIYLVFWFGGEGMPAPPDGGTRPHSARELEDRLRNTLAQEERHLIQVCVLDVSRPGS
jgi:hypothetical protein